MILPLLLALGTVVHAPHDPVYSLASTTLPDGRTVVVAVGTETTTLVSWNRGLTWEVLAGNGLETQTCWEVAYHPGLPAAGGAGLFVLGSEEGVWTWDPVADVVGTLHDGLPADDRHVLDLDAPLTAQDGPVILLTTSGGVYLLAPTPGAQWQFALQLPGVLARRGAVTLSPRYDSTAGDPREHELFAAASGLLYRSADGGATWTLEPTFSQTATSPNDWMISAIAVSEGWPADPTLMVGRVRVDPVSGFEQGELWRSTDAGATWDRPLTTTTGVQSVLCTPPGPGGQRTWLVAGRAYPNTGAWYQGILRSTDGGATWDDHGNAQDFLIEDNPGKTSGYVPLNYEQQLMWMPDYAQSGEVWYGRQEGLFVSRDEGDHWVERAMRAEREFRDLVAAVRPDGAVAVYGAGYGTGTVEHLPQTASSTPVGALSPMVYQRRLDVSPNFATDGNLMVAGNVTLWGWQSPDVPPANPTGRSGWWQPRNLDPNTGESLTGFARLVVYSPHFDGTGVGGDRAFFWNPWDFGPYRSQDNGVTAAPLHATWNGSVAPEMTAMRVAPTYDDLNFHQDVFGGDKTGQLFVLDASDTWNRIADLGPQIEDVEIPSDWSRPGNPVLYVALAAFPYLAEVRVEQGNVVKTFYSDGLDEVFPTGLALSPDFANEPVLYLSTFGSGIFSLDLRDAQPTWSPVGDGWPRLWCREVAVSPNWTQDRLVFAATQSGLWQVEDVPGGTWTDLTTTWLRDDRDEAFQYYQPLDPANPNPDHGWPWPRLLRWLLPDGIEAQGDDLAFSTWDGSWLETVARCSSFDVLTVAGPGAGSMDVEVFDYATGAPITSVMVDLAPLAATPQDHDVVVSLGTTRDVRIVVTANLDPGEMVAFDGLRLRR